MEEGSRAVGGTSLAVGLVTTMSHIAIQLDDAKHSSRRDDLEHKLIARGQLTLAELHEYRQWFAGDPTGRMLSEHDYATLDTWLTELARRAVVPAAKADKLKARVLRMRLLRC